MVFLFLLNFHSVTMSASSLIELIHTLSKGEKRYFRIFARRHAGGGEHQYEKLFDLINEWEGNDEQQLRALSADFIPASQYNYATHYLKQILLRALREYHYESSPGQTVRSKLDQMEILFKKGLLEHTQKLFRQVWKYVEQYGLIEYQPELLTWKRTLEKSSRTWSESGAVTIFKDRQAALKAAGVENRITYLYDQVFELLKSDRRLEVKESAERFKELRKEAKKWEHGDELPFHSRSLLLSTMGNLAHLEKNFQSLYQHCYDHINLWKQHPRQIQADPDRFSRVVGSRMNSVYLTGKAGGSLQEVEMLREIKGLPVRIKKELQARAYNIELLFLLDQGEPSSQSPLVKEVEAFLSRQGEKLPPQYLFSLWFNLAGLHFLSQNWQGVLKWATPVLHQLENVGQKGVTRAARIFQLIALFELGEVNGLESRLRSLSYHLKVKEQDWKLGKAFWELFSDLNKSVLNEYGKVVQEWRRAHLDQYEVGGGRIIGGHFYRKWLDRFA